MFPRLSARRHCLFCSLSGGTGTGTVSLGTRGVAVVPLSSAMCGHFLQSRACGEGTETNVNARKPPSMLTKHGSITLSHSRDSLAG